MLEQSEQTLLVTGGSGFIGQHLVARLLQLGHRVVVVDNHSTSHPLAPGHHPVVESAQTRAARWPKGATGRPSLFFPFSIFRMSPQNQAS